MADKTKNCFGLSWVSLTNVKNQVLFISSYFTTILGGRVGIGYVENKANSVQLQLQLPTGTGLGKRKRDTPGTRGWYRLRDRTLALAKNRVKTTFFSWGKKIT